MREGYYNHPINKSGKQKIIVSLWDFGATHPQKERRHLIDEDFAARMRPPLARALVKLYGRSPILDPMCGTGTTCFEAASLGMESYGIDIEAKNIAICRRSSPQIHGANILREVIDSGITNQRRIPTPSFQIADARMLPFHKESFGGIVFSPPYWNAISDKGRMSKGNGSPYIRSKGSPRTWRARAKAYGSSKGNVGSIRAYGRYLEEMGHIFRECFRVLQTNTFCIVVVKDLQRDFQLVPLHADLIPKALEADFILYDIVVNRMYHSAFWNVHHALNEQVDQGMPRSLRIHEYCLIFRKE